MNEFNQNPMASAKGLASLGRGDDSMLVHMTPREVSGLQSLAMAHGGSLSVNPQTGLPEAGFLDSILPTLVGVTTGLFTMNPWLGAAAGTAAGGVKRGIQGEKIFDPLQMGLDALGGYGGTSLATGLSAAGSGAAAQAANSAAAGQTAFSPLASESARTAAQIGTATPANIAAGLGEIGKTGFSAYAPAGSGLGAFGTAGGKALALDSAMAAAPLLPGMFAPQSPDPGALGISEDKTPLPEFEFETGTPSYASEDELRRGIEHDYFSPDRGFRRVAEGGLMSLAGGGEVSRYELGGTATAPATTTAPAPTTTTTTAPVKPNWLGAPAKGMPSGYYNIRPNLFPFYKFRGQQDYPGYGIYTPGSPKLTTWYNPQGNLMSGIRNAGQVVNRFGQNTPFAQELLRRASSAYRYPYDTEKYGVQQYGYVPPDVTPQMYNQTMREQARQYMGTPNAYVAYWNPELTPSFASGGLASFAAGGRPGVTQQGGYLDGEGDGMSDSIPATIANKQPARLADGEFVVPADVVSHLGNGSSKAGAKHLYSMMDRVRQARTGTTQQGKQINPGKFLKA